MRVCVYVCARVCVCEFDAGAGNPLASLTVAAQQGVGAVSGGALARDVYLGRLRARYGLPRCFECHSSGSSCRQGPGIIACCSALQCVAVDYPDVSSVIQVGLPADKAQVSTCVAVCCSVLQWITPTFRVSFKRVFLLTRLKYHGVLQCVAMYCSVVQCVAVCCSVLQCVAVCCSGLPRCFECHSSGPSCRQGSRTILCCGVLQCVVVWCCVLLCVAVCCCALQCVAVDYPDVSSVIQVGLPADKAQISKCVAVCCSVLQCVAVDYPDVSSVIQAGLPSDKAQVS